MYKKLGAKSRLIRGTRVPWAGLARGAGLGELGAPDVITFDNGMEFDNNATDEWTFKRKVKLDFIRSGKTNENAYIESFNVRFRDERSDENLFESVDHARNVIEYWRIDYNEERPHNLLQNLTSAEFARLLHEKTKVETGNGTQR